MITRIGEDTAEIRVYACSSVEKSSQHYNEVKSLHAQFHTKAADVITKALAKKKDQAPKAISPDSKYLVIPTNLTREMMTWRNNS